MTAGALPDELRHDLHEDQPVHDLPSEKKQNGIGQRAERHERDVREMPGRMHAREDAEELALARRGERNARIAEDDA
jgi:hypothetical protein